LVLVQMDWQLVANHLLHLIFAYLLALPIGWERELSKRHFGLRTFPLVAVVTCRFMLVGISVKVLSMMPFSIQPVVSIIAGLLILLMPKAKTT
jgi:uncharacterized membrane protein YhiD involved in acid resistance